MENSKINNIRAFAITTVVFGHSIILYSGRWGLYSSERTCTLLEYVKWLLDIYQMPLFFSLSGYLFAMTWKDRSTISFIVKKGRRLLVPFVLVGLFWMIPIKMAVKYPYYEGMSYFEIVKAFFKGYQLGHLWYLPTLFIVFLIVFVIMKCLGNSKIVYLGILGG